MSKFSLLSIATFILITSLESNAYTVKLCQYFSVMPDTNFEENIYIMSAGHCDIDIIAPLEEQKVIYSEKTQTYTAAPSIDENKVRQDSNDWDIMINPKYAGSLISNTPYTLPDNYENIPSELTLINQHGYEVTITSVSRYSESSFSATSNIPTKSGDSGAAIFDKNTGIVYGTLSGSDGEGFLVFTRLDIKNCFTNGIFSLKNDMCKLPK